MNMETNISKSNDMRKIMRIAMCSSTVSLSVVCGIRTITSNTYPQQEVRSGFNQ